MPTKAERASTHPYTHHDVQLPCYTPPYHHGEDERSSTKAMPCKSSDGDPVPIGVTSWLMDSGTSLDAVNRADVQAYLQHIIKGDVDA